MNENNQIYLISMSSLKKNFSIAKLYSDLQKYEQNITGFKDSRLKKQSSGSSMYQRPSSTQQKNLELRENYQQKNIGLTTNFQRFDKNKWLNPNLNANSIKGNYYGSEKYKKEEKNEKSQQNENLQRRYASREKRLMMKEIGGGRFQKNKNENNQQNEALTLMQNKRVSPFENKQNKCYNKNDQMYFLTQCFKLYNLGEKENVKNLKEQEEADIVKKLIGQINKRDKIYELVSNKLGVQNVEQKLGEFFKSYERLEKIIRQFKKMSKLQIEDQKELYQFLINEEPQIEEVEEDKENIQKVQECMSQRKNEQNDIIN